MIVFVRGRESSQSSQARSNWFAHEVAILAPLLFQNRLVVASGLYAANLLYDPLGHLHESMTYVDDAIPANDITVRRF